MLNRINRKSRHGWIRWRSPSCRFSPCRAQTLSPRHLETLLDVESINPSELISIASGVKDECMQLRWTFDDLLLSLPPLSSPSDHQQGHTFKFKHLPIMIKAVECLMQIRRLTSNVIRTSRYLSDYSRDNGDTLTTQWKHAALSSLDTMAEVIQGLSSSDALPFIEKLKDLLITIESSSSAYQVSQVRAWIKSCDHLLKSISTPHTPPTPELTESTSADDVMESQRVVDGNHLTGRKAALAAFSLLSNHTSFQPILLLHPVQAQALQEWLPPPPPPPNLYPSPSSDELVQSCARFGSLQLGSQSLPDGSYPPLNISIRISNNSNAIIDLSDLVDATDMAKEIMLKNQSHAASDASQYQGLVVAHLTMPLISSILCHHLDEGLRQQVYDSGLMKRERILLRAMEVLSESSNHQANNLVQVKGSIFRGEDNALSFLQDMEAALRPHAESELLALRELQSRFDINMNENPSASKPQLDGWNIDYLMTQSMKLNSRGGVNGSKWWKEWRDNFSIRSVLVGIDRVLSHIMALSIGMSSEGIKILEDGAWGLSGRVLVLKVADVSPLMPLSRASQPSVRARASQPSVRAVGTILIHLHQSGDCEFPFTTLINEGGGRRATSSRNHDTQPLSPQVQESRVTNESGIITELLVMMMGDDDDDDDSLDLPMTIIHIPDPSLDASLSSLSEDKHFLDLPLSSPFFMRALWHEMGHALHFLLSSIPPPSHRDKQQEEGFNPLSLPPPPPLNSCHSSIDIRELPSHLLELLSRNPQVLQAMSCHKRLGTHLSYRDSIRCATSPVMSGLMSSGYSTSIDLHESVVAAIADLKIHHSGYQDHRSDERKIEEVWREVWGRYSILGGGPGVTTTTTMERMRHIESISAVGGAKFVYPLSRLLAASVLKRFGLDRSSSSDDDGPDSLSRERWMMIRELLMHSGGHEEPSEVIMRVLGEESLVRKGELDREGWVVNFDASVYQGIELLD